MPKHGKKIAEFIAKLIQSDSRESSKRAIALFITLLIGYIVIAFTNPHNILLVLAELIGFVTGLLYIASGAKAPKLPNIFKGKNDENKEKIEP